MKLIKLSLIVLYLSVFSLNADEADSKYGLERVWVFVQFNTPAEQGGFVSNYYYGSIDKSMYKLIAQNKLHAGFIHLQEVAYWGEDDKIYDFKNEESTGDLIFRIENIVKLELINERPKIDIVDEKVDFLTEPAKHIGKPI